MARFGLGLPPDATSKEDVELVGIAERAGFEILWVADERFFREVYSTITLCALNSTKIKLGTSVTDPYTRSPALTAMAIATVDEISHGRAVLGIGAGISGLKQLGIDRDKPIGAIHDAVTVIRGMLAGEKVVKKGPIVNVDGAKLDFEARKDIPVYIGGKGPQLIELAGQIAEGVILGSGRGASKKSLDYALEHLEMGAKKAKRDASKIDVVSWVGTSVSEDADKAKDRLRAFVAYMIFASAIPMLESLGIKADEAESVKQGIAKKGYTTGTLMSGAPEMLKDIRPLVRDGLVDTLTVAGSPDECVTRIKEILSSGSKLFSILPFPPSGTSNIEMVKLFAEEVVPAFN